MFKGHTTRDKTNWHTRPNSVYLLHHWNFFLWDRAVLTCCGLHPVQCLWFLQLIIHADFQNCNSYKSPTQCKEDLTHTQYTPDFRSSNTDDTSFKRFANTFLSARALVTSCLYCCMLSFFVYVCVLKVEVPIFWFWPPSSPLLQFSPLLRVSEKKEVCELILTFVVDSFINPSVFFAPDFVVTSRNSHRIFGVNVIV